ncbi:MAG TPA: chromosome segregation protein SMC, partial [Clostridia bacterium]|nr:chromosome segregation protein SMC [Clostridia bacterium]
MLLKKLEMYGFKSFADRIEIQFDQGITAIVGPNGSGKSNVADAVRWVLGEQSAKSLRGSKMEDIIFSGTQIRKPLGFAEVSLTLDNTDHALPVDFSEVTITRRVFRSGESEYYINRSSCRLRDIIELFMDTGVGKEGYSIIGQGRIDEILSTQPENRRMIFEEAAGIVKYKSRKQESQRKLERTQENIVRVEDILREITQQLGPLEEQSKTAREYLNLRENLKSYELNKFIFEYAGYKKKIEDIKQNTSLIEQDIVNHRQNIHEQEIKENKLNEESVNLDKRIQSIRDNRFTILNEAEKLRGKIEVIQERIAQLDREKIRLEQEIQWGKQTIEEKQIEKTNSSEELKIGKQTLSTIVQKSELLTRRLEFIKNQLSSSHIEAQAKKDRIMQIWNSLSKTKNTITKYQTLEENLLSQRKQSNDHLKELGRSWETLTSKHRNIEQNIENLNKKLLRRRNENDILEEKAQFLEKKIEEWDNKLQLQKQQLEGEKSRLNLLIDMSNSYDGFQKSVKGILRACQSNASIKDRVCGVIAELVRVPKEYETAIETALGFSLQHIVTHSEEDAKYIIEFLRNRRLGRATFLPISSIKGRNLYNREKTVLSMEGCLGRGVDLIEFDSQYKEIFTNLLGRVIITENLEQAINIAKNFSYSFRVVTLEGDVMNSGGSMTGGSMNKRTTGIIGRGREIDDLKDKTAKLVKDMESGIVKRKVCLEEYTELRGNLKDILPQIHQLEIQIATGREHLDGTSLEIERADREIQSLRQKDVKLAQEIVTMKESIDKQDKLSAELEKQSKDIQAVADNTDSSIESINKEKDQIEEESTRIKIEEARLDHEIHSLEEKLILINRDIENYTI